MAKRLRDFCLGVSTNKSLNPCQCRWCQIKKISNSNTFMLPTESPNTPSYTICNSKLESLINKA